MSILPKHKNTAVAALLEQPEGLGPSDANKESLATKSSQLDDKMSDLATTQMDLTETTALLHDDRTYLKDLTEQCERKAREWDQRSQMRKDELTAIGTALEIIEGTVLTRETSTGAGGRSEPVGAALVESSEDDSDFIEDYLADSFVQVKKVEVRK